MKKDTLLSLGLLMVFASPVERSRPACLLAEGTLVPEQHNPARAEENVRVAVGARGAPPFPVCLCSWGLTLWVPTLSLGHVAACPLPCVRKLYSFFKAEFY